MPTRRRPTPCGRRVLRKAVVALIVAAAGPLGAAPAVPLAATLLAGMAQTPPVSTPFVQVAYRGVLDRPLVVSGTLRWAGGDSLERNIDKPFKEVAKVDAGEITLQRGDNEVQHVALARAPQVGAMLTGFRALLDGDAAALQADFTLTAQGSQEHWVLVLTPRTDALKRQLQSIVIDGRKGTPRCLTMRDANGDTSITLLGALAEAGLKSAAPLESALAARCRNTP